MDTEQVTDPVPELWPDTPQLPDPQRPWMTTCPRCGLPVFGEDSDESLAAWYDHDETAHGRPHVATAGGTGPAAGDLHGDALLAALATPGHPVRVWAADAVHAYFTDGTRSGRQFERLGRDAFGADPSPDEITPTDLVAVTMLGVVVPPQVCIDVLGSKAARIRELLSDLEDDPLHTASPEVFDRGRPAWDLWDLLRVHGTGMGRTTTSKLLARKRPHLLPISDSRVDHRLDIPGDENLWAWWSLRWHRPRFADQIAMLRAEAGGVDDISLLRILDVAVWSYDEALRPRLRAPGTGLRSEG